MGRLQGDWTGEERERRGRGEERERERRGRGPASGRLQGDWTRSLAACRILEGDGGYGRRGRRRGMDVQLSGLQVSGGRRRVWQEGDGGYEGRETEGYGRAA